MFINFFKETEVWKLILSSLVFQLVDAIIQYCNIRRYNLQWGIGDYEFNMVLAITGKAALISLNVLPMTILMMYIVPKNIEASMFAMITAILTLSTDWAGDLVGAFYCDALGVTSKDLSNFHQIAFIKIFAVLVCIIFAQYMLPTN